jgi:diguanylate cyclase (GGDEF)-like protein
MNIFFLGQLVHTVGAALLGGIFLYLSRGKGNRTLHAAGVAWVFLSLSLASLLLLSGRGLPFETLLFQYWKTFFIVAVIVAARRMDRQTGLARPLTITALAGLPLSLGLVLWGGSGPEFYAVHALLLAISWIAVAVLISTSRTAGVGKRFAAILAIATAAFQAAYAVFYGLAGPSNASAQDPFLVYAGFYDLFLEMLFGIGLIIWAMEETETRLSVIHARAVDDTRRRKRLALIDPLTEVYNRHFFDEIRPSLEREAAGGSVVLVDVDELKTINDTEGHEQGDKAIWTIASGIKKLIRGADFLIRWGGDEFLVILPGMDEEIAKKRFYMLPGKLEEVRQAPRLKERAYQQFLAASVGVARFSRRIPLEKAIEKADSVMYERKKAHKEMRG